MRIVLFYTLMMSMFIVDIGHAGIVYEIPIEQLDYTIETIDGFARLSMAEAAARVTKEIE